MPLYGNRRSQPLAMSCDRLHRLGQKTPRPHDHHSLALLSFLGLFAARLEGFPFEFRHTPVNELRYLCVFGVNALR
jgi:hypothetical protein